MLRELGDGRSDASSRLDTLGVEDGSLLRAARKDLRRFLEAVLAPVILSEQSLDVVGDDATPDEVGVREALLVEAADQVADDASVKEQVGQASTDDRVIEILEEAVARPL